MGSSKSKSKLSSEERRNRTKAAASVTDADRAVLRLKVRARKRGAGVEARRARRCPPQPRRALGGGGWLASERCEGAQRSPWARESAAGAPAAARRCLCPELTCAPAGVAAPLSPGACGAQTQRRKLEGTARRLQALADAEAQRAREKSRAGERQAALLGE